MNLIQTIKGLFQFDTVPAVPQNETHPSEIYSKSKVLSRTLNRVSLGLNDQQDKFVRWSGLDQVGNPIERGYTSPRASVRFFELDVLDEEV